MLITVVMLLAVICLFCAAIDVKTTRVNLLALGLMLWALTVLVAGFTVR
jgi:hypothetical protein